MNRRCYVYVLVPFEIWGVFWEHFSAWSLVGLRSSRSMIWMILLMAEILHQLKDSSFPLFTGFYTSQVAQDFNFSHQRYGYFDEVVFSTVYVGNPPQRAWEYCNSNSNTILSLVQHSAGKTISMSGVFWCFLRHAACDVTFFGGDYGCVPVPAVNSYIICSFSLKASRISENPLTSWEQDITLMYHDARGGPQKAEVSCPRGFWVDGLLWKSPDRKALKGDNFFGLPPFSTVGFFHAWENLRRNSQRVWVFFEKIYVLNFHPETWGRFCLYLTCTYFWQTCGH